MDVERIIDEIEQLEEMFEAPDLRPLSASDISAANRRHDEMLAHVLGSGTGNTTVSDFPARRNRKLEAFVQT